MLFGVQYVADGFIRFSSSTDDKALVIFQGLEPVLYISGVVFEAASGFKPYAVKQCSGAYFSAQLFAGITFAAKVCRGIQPIEASCVSR